MRALDIPFEEVLHPFDDGEYGASYERFRSFSPTGLVPCLHHHDEDNQKLVIWESLAIVEHLSDYHNNIWPSDPVARAWARSAVAEMHAGFSALRNECPMTVGLTIRLNQVSADLNRDLQRISELWRQGLSTFGGPYLAGAHFTAVDAFYAPVVFRLNTYQLSEDVAVLDYMHHLLAHEAMQSWQAQGEQETLREPGHEEEIAALGEILEDRRA